MSEHVDVTALLAEILPPASTVVIPNHFDTTVTPGCSGLCESPGGCKGITSAS